MLLKVTHVVCQTPISFILKHAGISFASRQSAAFPRETTDDVAALLPAQARLYDLCSRGLCHFTETKIDSQRIEQWRDFGVLKAASNAEELEGAWGRLDA